MSGASKRLGSSPGWVPNDVFFGKTVKSLIAYFDPGVKLGTGKC